MYGAFDQNKLLKLPSVKKYFKRSVKDIKKGYETTAILKSLALSLGEKILKIWKIWNEHNLRMQKWKFWKIWIERIWSQQKKFSIFFLERAYLEYVRYMTVGCRIENCCQNKAKVWNFGNGVLGLLAFFLIFNKGKSKKNR